MSRGFKSKTISIRNLSLDQNTPFFELDSEKNRIAIKRNKVRNADWTTGRFAEALELLGEKSECKRPMATTITVVSFTRAYSALLFL